MPNPSTSRSTPHQRAHATLKSASTTIPVPQPLRPAKKSQEYQQKVAGTAKQHNELGKCTCHFQLNEKIVTVTADIKYIVSETQKSVGETHVEYKPTQLQRDKICADSCKKEQDKLNAKQLADVKMQQTLQVIQTVSTVTLIAGAAAYGAHRLFRAYTQKPETKSAANKTHHNDHKQHRTR